MGKTKAAIRKRMEILEKMYLTDTPFSLAEKTQGVSGTFRSALIRTRVVLKRKDGLYTFVAEKPSIEMAISLLNEERKFYHGYQRRDSILVEAFNHSCEAGSIEQPKLKEFSLKIDPETKEVIIPLKSFITLIG